MTAWSDIESQLDACLEARHEDYDVDYKLTIDLSSRQGTVELAKDVGAFLDKGGAIVIGSDEHGRPQGGIHESQIGDWDESRVRAKLSPYLGYDFPLRVTRHERAGIRLALLWILPHPDGCAVFRKDGHTGAGGGSAVFRSGDIYTRNGTASRRAEYEDVRRILAKSAQRAIAAEKAAAMARAAAYEVAVEVEAESVRRWGHDAPHGGSALVGSVAFAASYMPTDVTRRIFYDPNFPLLMWNLLEGQDLRRNGHYFASNEQRDPHQIRMSGTVDTAGFIPGYIDVRARGDGCVVVGFAENTASWSWDEVVAWWYYGAWKVALKLLTNIGAAGALFSCHLTHLPGTVRTAELSIQSDMSPRVTDGHTEDINRFCREQVMRIHRAGKAQPLFGMRPEGGLVDIEGIRQGLAKGRRLSPSEM